MRDTITRTLFSTAIAIATALPIGVQAQSLSGALTADDAFDAYLSTSATTQGTLLTSGTYWGTTYTFSNAALVPGQQYFLQVKARDLYASITAMIGSFSLSSTDFEFANGDQTLNTNTTNWFSSETGFGVDAATPVSLGVNGVSPWGTRPGIAATAEWIWDEPQCFYCTRYFWTSITPTTVEVPEPGSLALVVSGLVGLGVVTRRRRRA